MQPVHVVGIIPFDTAHGNFSKIPNAYLTFLDATLFLDQIFLYFSPDIKETKSATMNIFLFFFIFILNHL